MATEAEYWRARAILELMADRHPFTSGDPDEVRRWIREVIADMKTGDFNEDLYTIVREELDALELAP